MRTSARLSYYPAQPLALAGGDQGGLVLDRVVIVAEYDEVVRSPVAGVPDPLGRRAEGFRQTPEARGLHALQSFSARRILLPVLRAKGDLTFDHVLPRSRGGITSWENVVAACSPCNLRKGNKTLRQAGLSVRKPAKCASPAPRRCRQHGRRFPPNHLHRKLARLPLLGCRARSLT
jgi:5-methylcytosine-specific restriction endonuclease McrA